MIQRTCETIINYFDLDLEYHDSLSHYFAHANFWRYVIIKSTAFETAKAYGLLFLRDDTIRILLADVYEMNLPFILNFEQRQRDFYNINDIPILIEHFNHSGYGPFGVLKMIPSDYERLKKTSGILIFLIQILLTEIQISFLSVICVIDLLKYVTGWKRKFK